MFCGNVISLTGSESSWSSQILKTLLAHNHTHNMKQQLNTHTTAIPPSDADKPVCMLLALPGELDGTLTLAVQERLHGCSWIQLLYALSHLLDKTHAARYFSYVYQNLMTILGHFEVLYTFSFQSCIPPTNGAGYVTPMYIPYLGFMLTTS